MMKGVVAAGHPLTAEAAATILRAGGNAFDAASAAMLTACVAEPVLASLGGGGFLLAQPAGEAARVVDFFTHTPQRRDLQAALDFHPVTVDFGSAEQEFHIGLGACAVPGCVRGLCAVQRELGRIPLRTVIEPAVAAARTGIAINDLQAYIFRLVAPIYMTPSAARLFASRREPAHIARAGEQLRFPEFADFLEVLAIEGEALFYRGEIAAAVAELCAEQGGYLTRADFNAYRHELRAPLVTDYRGVRLLTNPPPSCGGLLMSFGLRLLESQALPARRHGELGYWQTLIEVMRQTHHARLTHTSDITDAATLLAPELVADYQALLADTVLASRGTTHISVADATGNLAAVTISNGEGCGCLIPDTGIMLNNMLGETDLNPQGFHEWPLSTRMNSMMAPSILQFPDGRRVVTGSGGSNRIRTVLLQVVSNLVDFDMHVGEAVRSPRVHIEDEVLNVEGGLPGDVVDGLTARYPQHRLFRALNLFFGGAHTVACSGSEFEGAGDPRRGGVCIEVA